MLAYFDTIIIVSHIDLIQETIEDNECILHLQQTIAYILGLKKNIEALIQLPIDQLDLLSLKKAIQDIHDE